MASKQSLLSVVVFSSCLLLSNALSAAACPSAQQPLLSNGLELMIHNGQADDALQCIFDLQGKADNQSDEVWYQLAKNASDAIERLGEEGGGFPIYHDRAASLWDSYLQNVSAPFDATRVSFALTKIMQHGRFTRFEQFIPSIAKAFNRGGARIALNQADQFFATFKRCPNWNVVSKVNAGGDLGGACTKPCGDIAKLILSSLSDELGQRPWVTSAGTKRLTINANAMEESFQCKPK